MGDNALELVRHIDEVTVHRGNEVELRLLQFEWDRSAVFDVVRHVELVLLRIALGIVRNLDSEVLCNHVRFFGCHNGRKLSLHHDLLVFELLCFTSVSSSGSFDAAMQQQSRIVRFLAAVHVVDGQRKSSHKVLKHYVVLECSSGRASAIA